MNSHRASHYAWFGVVALLYTGSAMMTIVWCESMSAMGHMTMPGGWTMSTTYMRMPGQTWAGAAASFLVMWLVMTIAMMLPILGRVLWRFREQIEGADETRKARLSALVSAGYFFVWAALGVGVFAAGAGLTVIEMREPSVAGAVPLAAGLVLLIAGALQFTTWKARQLACCRELPGHGRALPLGAREAWWDGLRFGIRCICCCAGLTALLLVLGVTHVWAMVAVTVAISLERLAAAGERVARVTGVVIMAAGVGLIVAEIAHQPNDQPYFRRTMSRMITRRPMISAVVEMVIVDAPPANDSLTSRALLATALRSEPLRVSVSASRRTASTPVRAANPRTSGWPSAWRIAAWSACSSATRSATAAPSADGEMT